MLTKYQQPIVGDRYQNNKGKWFTVIEVNRGSVKIRFDDRGYIKQTTTYYLRSGSVAYHYYYAAWCRLDGKEKYKNFSVKRYGEEEAFRLACEYREKMISLLNTQGAGYTGRHGK